MYVRRTEYGVRIRTRTMIHMYYVQYMYSAYLYLAAVALAESDGLQRFALEYDMYSTCTLHGIHLYGEVLMCHSSFVHMYCIRTEYIHTYIPLPFNY